MHYPKSIFVSKTFLFNVLTIATAFATYYGYTPNQEMSDKVAQTLLAVSPFVNIVLRYFTTKPVYLM